MLIYIALFIFAVAILSALSVIFMKDVAGAVIVSSVVSLLASILFLLMAAPDVAITEASIGAALTLIIFMFALFKMRKGEK